jgi:hypothetical protein
MANLTNAKIANTFKDLLQVNAATSNAGLDGTVRTIQDGGGTASPIAMSTAQLNVSGQFALGGTVLTATADQLNNLAAGGFTALTHGNGTVLLTMGGVSVSTATTSATVVVNPTLSLTEVDAATGSFSTKVSGVAAEFSGNVSAANLFASTNIFIGGTAIPNAAALTSVSNVITALSATMATSIAARTAAITSVNTVITNLSATMATSINNRTTAITANTAAITSVNTVITNLSATFAASIGNRTTAITANTAAITSINTVVANVSSTLATSIATRLPLAGGTLTGTVSGTTLVMSAGVGLGAVSTLLGKKLRLTAGGAIADLVTLTDGANISVNLNTGQNFTVTLAGNRTLDNPTNCVAGQVGSIFITQDGTGSRTLAFGSSWDFPGGTAPVLSTDAAARDRLDYIVQTSTDVQAVLTKAYS